MDVLMNPPRPVDIPPESPGQHPRNIKASPIFKIEPGVMIELAVYVLFTMMQIILLWYC
jgi:hypothetical protein